MTQKWTQTASCILVLVVLGAIGTAFNPKPASAQGNKPVTQVNIVDSVPLPISGSVSISNSSPVPVTLSSSTPLPVQNVDEPARNPYQENQFTVCGGPQNCNFTFATVPAGKRLVITHINGWVDVAGGTLPNGNLESNFGGNQYATVFFVYNRGTVSTNGNVRMVINQEVLAYFGPGEQPSAFDGLFGTNDHFTNSGFVQLSGYYVNLP